MQTTTYNAGIYTRLSRDDERTGESVSIENQKEMLTCYVREQGWNLVSTYVDDGVSGTTFDRPGLNEMISDARKGKINLRQHRTENCVQKMSLRGKIKT